MSLQSEIDKMRAEIRTDDYSMSIGEWMSIYENDELDIHPEFQRFYRWTDFQKTRLIESILLGIPVPLIFVAQREDGVWDVVDGLQRLSTIFQFAGILKGEDGGIVPPFQLTGTDYLPSLEGMTWENGEDPERSLTASQRLQIKRSKIGVSIILKESDSRSKYDLFQRLNTGGSPLSDQEMRNCVLVMLNSEFFRWLSDLGNLPSFKECIALTDRLIDEQFHLELALRFIIFRRMPIEDIRFRDLSKYIYDRMIEIATDPSFNYDVEADAFSRTFELLRVSLGSDSFRRFDPRGAGRFVGGFLISGFETVGLGVGYNVDGLENGAEVAEKVKQLWQREDFQGAPSAGVRTPARITRLVSVGREIFAP